MFGLIIKTSRPAFFWKIFSSAPFRALLVQSCLLVASCNGPQYNYAQIELEWVDNEANPLSKRNPIVSSRIELFSLEDETPTRVSSVELPELSMGSISVPPGNYLLLADCSSTEIVLRPRQTKKVVLSVVNFKYPETSEAMDPALDRNLHAELIVHCERFRRLEAFEQKITKPERLVMLNGKWEVLVGIKPLTIDIPTISEIKLGALRVTKPESTSRLEEQEKFFVFDENQAVSSVVHQTVGERVYLPAGKYRVELNATQVLTELTESVETVLNSKMLKFSAEKNARMMKERRLSNIEPPSIYLEKKGILEFDQAISVLDTPVSFDFQGGLQSETVVPAGLKEGSFAARSLRVTSDCPPREDSCLGGTTVLLFQKGAYYPFQKSVTDRDIFFSRHSVFASLEGMETIQHEIPDDVNSAFFTTGTVIIKPQPVLDAVRTTDLLRFESAESWIKGNSYDLSLTENTEVRLIEGRFYLSRYDSSFRAADSDRVKKQVPFSVVSGAPIVIEIPIFLGEKAYFKWLSEFEKIERLRSLSRLRRVETTGGLAKYAETR